MNLMQKAAPKHVMEGLCQRLKEIETHENDTNGALLADECRKYIYSQDEILWMHVLMTAYYINGGVMLREAKIRPTSSSTCTTNSSQGPSEVSTSSTASISSNLTKRESFEIKQCSHESNSKKEGLKKLATSGCLDLHVPEMLEMEEMIRSMNVS